VGAEKFGTKVEVKNLNSFRSAERAIDFEIKRMIDLIEDGKIDEIVQETRGWDEVGMKTFSQRKKETANDYRYFPEPDLPKMMLHEVFDLDQMKAALPELPWEKKERLLSVGLAENTAEILTSDLNLALFFDEVVGNETDKDLLKLVSNYITSDLLSLLKEGTSMPSATNFRKLMDMVKTGEISSRGAKDILAIMVKEDKDPAVISEENGLSQKSDEGELKAIIEKIISEN
jgi:aspartyl-tRNA(Asn)/glutamyl-tRNA(Gln) amidotransferase subunit B